MIKLKTAEIKVQACLSEYTKITVKDGKLIFLIKSEGDGEIYIPGEHPSCRIIGSDESRISINLGYETGEFVLYKDEGHWETFKDEDGTITMIVGKFDLSIESGIQFEMDISRGDRVWKLRDGVLNWRAEIIGPNDISMHFNDSAHACELEFLYSFYPDDSKVADNNNGIVPLNSSKIRIETCVDGRDDLVLQGKKITWDVWDNGLWHSTAKPGTHKECPTGKNFITIEGRKFEIPTNDMYWREMRYGFPVGLLSKHVKFRGELNAEDIINDINSDQGGFIWKLTERDRVSSRIEIIGERRITIGKQDEASLYDFEFEYVYFPEDYSASSDINPADSISRSDNKSKLMTASIEVEACIDDCMILTTREGVLTLTTSSRADNASIFPGSHPDCSDMFFSKGLQMSSTNTIIRVNGKERILPFSENGYWTKIEGYGHKWFWRVAFQLSRLIGENLDFCRSKMDSVSVPEELEKEASEKREDLSCRVINPVRNEIKVCANIDDIFLERFIRQPKLVTAKYDYYYYLN